MKARALALAALALLLPSACAKTTTRPGIRFDGPSAVAVFRGFTTRDAALRTYLAVANERANDLRILDGLTGTAVLAPGLILSLSVPTEPRPALLAAGSLHDAAPAPDLLVVAPAGQVDCGAQAGAPSGCLQVVATWTAATAVATSLTLDLGALAGEGASEVLGLVVIPVPEESAPGVFTARQGRARLVAALSGQKLLIADYRRAADGLAIEPDTADLPDPAQPGATLTVPRVRVHALGFTARSLAASPDLRHLYAATLDPIGAVEGVAELDLTSPAVTDPGAGVLAPPVRGLDAGAPTTLVMAALVREFVDTPLAGTTTALTPDQYGPEVLRVYAALDPTRCGPLEPIACGLVALDPALGGRLPDPAGELPYRAPMQVPGTILAMTPIYPPAWGGADLAGTEAIPPGTVPPVEVALQKLQLASGAKWTSTLAAIGSTTGATYLADLGHFGLANEQWLAVPGALTFPTQVQTLSVTVPQVDEELVAYPETPGLAEFPRIGVWNDLEPLLDGQGNPIPVVVADDIRTDQLIALTPGYSASEDWRISFEGALPGLQVRQGEVRVGPAGLEWVAIQTATGLPPPAEPFRGSARLYDPRLGIQPGDIVRITPTDPACPSGEPAFEVRVDSLLAPDAASYPGGALAVTQPAALPACLQVAQPTVRAAKITIRAKELLLVGSATGYAGRPQFDVPFALRWEDEAALSCPMLQDPTWPPADPTCDATCRATCERLLLARKARRFAYVTERCPTALENPTSAEEVARKVACEKRWTRVTSPQPPPLAFPNAKGEVIGFRLGKGWVSVATAPLDAMRRETNIFLSVRSGLAQASRRPTSSGSITGDVFPQGYATYDRSADTRDPAIGMRVYGAYPSNLVIDFSPSVTAIATYR